jgi:hypothetical protein
VFQITLHGFTQFEIHKLTRNIESDDNYPRKYLGVIQELHVLVEIQESVIHVIKEGGVFGKNGGWWERKQGWIFAGITIILCSLIALLTGG